MNDSENERLTVLKCNVFICRLDIVCVYCVSFKYILFFIFNCVLWCNMCLYDYYYYYHYLCCMLKAPENFYLQLYENKLFRNGAKVDFMSKINSS